MVLQFRVVKVVGRLVGRLVGWLVGWLSVCPCKSKRREVDELGCWDGGGAGCERRHPVPAAAPDATHAPRLNNVPTATGPQGSLGLSLQRAATARTAARKTGQNVRRHDLDRSHASMNKQTKQGSLESHATRQIWSIRR